MGGYGVTGVSVTAPLGFLAARVDRQIEESPPQGGDARSVSCACTEADTGPSLACEVLLRRVRGPGSKDLGKYGFTFH